MIRHTFFGAIKITVRPKGACCDHTFWSKLGRQFVSLTRMHHTSPRNQLTSKLWRLTTCCHVCLGKYSGGKPKLDLP
ncbi:hypothetical protein WJX77_007313 [Trebouxia sp. C0004]